jgi:hypothetical protein
MASLSAPRVCAVAAYGPHTAAAYAYITHKRSRTHTQLSNLKTTQGQITAYSVSPNCSEYLSGLFLFKYQLSNRATFLRIPAYMGDA